MDGATNGAWFLSSVDDVLVPALKPGDTAVMDDLSAYKVKGGRDAVEAEGVRLLGLPACGRDLSPLAKAFAKLKALLWSAGAAGQGVQSVSCRQA